MQIQIILLATLLTVISAGPFCKDADGLYPNPDDRTTYIECIGGQESFRRCPRSEDGRSYQVFDGQTCVEQIKVFSCPQPTGYYRYLSDDRQYYECIDSKPVLKKCPENTVFDGLACSAPTGPVSESLTYGSDFICPQTSGVFRNPTDVYHYTYYECYNGVPTMRSCPAFTASRDSGYYQERMVFNGQNCVKPTANVILPRQPVYDDRVPTRRQVDVRLDPRCGGYDGLYQSSTEIQTWYECINGEPQRIYTCEAGQVLDTVTRVCRATTVRDEEVVVHKPETVVVESSPRVVELNRQERPRDTYYPGQQGNYYGRRYRRNGRVEFEDQNTGGVIVDTWNEGAWRWEREMNGRRLPLPQVNDWVDYGWRARGVGYEVPVQPQLEYRQAPVQYVNDPRYNRRYNRRSY